GQVVDAMLAQMSVSFPKMFGDLTANSTELTAAEKEEITQQAAEMFERFSARFREEVGRQIDFKKYEEDLSLSLYDKYFTESELQDMIAYYRTPTGQKALRVLPQLTADSVKQSAEQLGPQIGRIAQQIMQEELNDLKQKPGREHEGQTTP